jgi:hypothetical protein
MIVGAQHHSFMTKQIKYLYFVLDNKRMYCKFQVMYVPSILRSCSRSVSLSKRPFFQHGRHPKIGITNFGGILHHSLRIGKQKALTRRVDKNVAHFISSLIFPIKNTY